MKKRFTKTSMTALAAAMMVTSTMPMTVFAEEEVTEDVVEATEEVIEETETNEEADAVEEVVAETEDVNENNTQEKLLDEDEIVEAEMDEDAPAVILDPETGEYVPFDESDSFDLDNTHEDIRRIVHKKWDILPGRSYYGWIYTYEYVDDPTYNENFCFTTNEYDGKDYWFEYHTIQGDRNDPKCLVTEDGIIRGREIYDPSSDAWYWLDACYGGAKAVNKEVWMPYIYQTEKDWSAEQREQESKASGTMAAQVLSAINEGTGKWVRYDAKGHMVKGWYTVKGDDAKIYPTQAGNTYYYDYKTGLMAKGMTEIDGQTYQFDEVTGVLIK